MTRRCPKCQCVCDGEDLGDNGTYLNFDCECGHSWGEECYEDFMVHADNLRKAQKESGGAR